jgi:hypothetical protein
VRPDLGWGRCDQISTGTVRRSPFRGEERGGNIGASRRRREEHRGGAAASRSPAALTRVLQINGEGEEENLG